jgi:hypothetical protein
MALPSSGVLTLNDIQTEFGGTNPIDLSEYYRGGGLVPDTAGNAGIPTSGVISVTDFYGAANSISLDFVRRTQYTPSASTTISSVAIGTANPNRMVILQSNVVNASHNVVQQVTACTIGGVTATIFGSFSTGQIIYAKVPTGTTANIVITYSSSAIMRLQVNTINTINSGPTLQSTGTVPNPGSLTFTQNPVDPEGIFMWGYLAPAFAYQSGFTLSTDSAGGVDVVPGYSVSQGTSPSATVTRASMAVSETSNSDSRFVRVTQSPTGKAASSAHAVYFKAN